MRGILALHFLFSPAAFGEALIRVRPHVVVQPGSDVKLAQLVDAQGLSAEAEAALQGTNMAKAPAYGERHQLAQASLMEVLRPIIQSERGRIRGQVRLLMPKSVTVDTLKRELNAEMVWRELQQVWQPLCADCKLELEGLSLPAIQGVRDWSLKLKAELPRGSFSVPVTIIRADTAPVSAWISGRLVTKRKVPVLARALATGERIQEKDIRWEFRDTSFATDGVPEAADLANRQIRQGMRAGEVLWAGMILKEKAVRRGELVQVRSSEGIWEISMTVVAQQDAYIGDTINLKNPKTNSILVGQVTGQNEVELR